MGANAARPDEVDEDEDETILQRMIRQNPWWTTGAVPPTLLGEFKRRDCRALAGRLDEPHVQGVLGAQRVGKTTMLYQMIADLIAGGTDPQRILLLSLDRQGLAPSTKNLLRMLELYARALLGESVHQPTERIYVVLDEVHLVRDWQRVAKNFFDLALPVKFVVSGSGADMLADPPGSLVGRVWYQTLASMSFAEYASFRSPEHAGALSAAGSDMRACMDEAARGGGGGAERFYGSVRRALLGLAAARDVLEARLSDYMLHGGYPEIAALDKRRGRAEAIRTCMDIALYKYAAEAAGGARDPAVLARLFHVIARGSPRTISRAGMSRRLGIGRAAVDAYCEALRRSLLVSYSEFYTAEPDAPRRREQRAYVNDVGMRNAAAGLDESDAISDPAEAGMIAETVACDHARRLWHALAPASEPPMPHFWHNGGGAEVDLVIRLHRRPIPIEIKYRRHVEMSHLKGLSRFSARFDPPLAIAVSRDGARLADDRIVVVPMWLYLLMC